ncbi:MAG: VOC family protein, partial [Chloroflexota bacterium]
MTNATTTKTKVIAYLCANGASHAIDFYKRAFGAEERYRMEDGGRIGHAEITIGDTVLYISDEWPEMQVLSPNTLG